MQTAIVTGGAGFLGSNLCEYLLTKGIRVLCVDNKATSTGKNISRLIANKNFMFIQHDIIEPIKIEGPVDYIFHLASPAVPSDQQKMQIQTMLANAHGTQNVLELALGKKAKFLLASTCEVYGDPLVNPQPETYWGNVNPVGERSTYDESKRFAEALTMAYHRTYNLQTKIARIFHSYGPGMREDDNRVVPSFITKALKQQPLTISGNGSQTRSLCYASDIIEGLYLLINSEEDLPVNLGNPEEISITELAQKILQLTHSKSTINYSTAKTDDPKVKCPDISKAKTILNWQPKVSLNAGLKLTIDYFQKQISPSEA